MQVPFVIACSDHTDKTLRTNVSYALREKRGHFRVAFNLIMEARLSAKLLLLKLVPVLFYDHIIQSQAVWGFFSKEDL